jgi:hypothetical protein
VKPACLILILILGVTGNEVMSLKQEALVNAVVAYISFFGSRFVGNDIAVTCGSLIDHPIAKTITLFAIMYQAARDVRAALVATAFFLVLQYLASRMSACHPYKDKPSAPDVDVRGRAWPSISKGANPPIVQKVH